MEDEIPDKEILLCLGGVIINWGFAEHIIEDLTAGGMNGNFLGRLGS
jgi:hypothetical protein